MIYLWVALMMLGFVVFALGLFEVGLFIIPGLALMASSMYFLISTADAQRTKDHKHILKDLQSEGWHVKFADIHAADETVDIGCAQFTVAKLKGKWYTVVDRSKALGGGYNVVTSDREKKLREACP